MSDSKDNQEKVWRFYFAGSYSELNQLRVQAGNISRRSGWECSSRWLDGSHSKKPQVLCAREDMEDLLSADIFLMSLQYDSSLDDMWVELGIALSHNMHVVVLKPTNSKITPFLRLDGVRIFHSAEEVESYLIGLRTNSTEPPRYMPVSGR